jgi:hypothetical protein
LGQRLIKITLMWFDDKSNKDFSDVIDEGSDNHNIDVV